MRDADGAHLRQKRQGGHLSWQREAFSIPTIDSTVTYVAVPHHEYTKVLPALFQLEQTY